MKDTQYNMGNEWLAALTRGEVTADKPRPKKTYKSYQVSNKQRKGIKRGNK
jgi:hypothetical protein